MRARGRAPADRARRAGARQAPRAGGPGGVRRPPPPRVRALRALRHGERPRGAPGVDSVLTAIVRRARQLLGTDVSYLTLNDDARGDTYMRVTDGSVSARFQALRLPMGAGSEAWSPRRRRPTRRPTTSPTRASGTPPTSTTAFRTRAWSRSSVCRSSAGPGDRRALRRRPERALLRPLRGGPARLARGHAAIALDNARLLEETRAALDELSAATRELRAHTASVERAAGRTTGSSTSSCGAAGSRTSPPRSPRRSVAASPCSTRRAG